METFSALPTLCGGNPPVTGGFSSQRPVTRSFDVFFDLRLNKRWNKKSRCRRFETPSRSLWCHCNVALCCVYLWPDRDYSCGLFISFGITPLASRELYNYISIPLRANHDKGPSTCPRPIFYVTVHVLCTLIYLIFWIVPDNVIL